ncbi:MAG: UDP-N-acetylmuramoyl-L-alanyl-D-glutamate--2,6-diaminopimelate ligase [Oscillospiraceae bacterium]|nr:UDP-N-acetylmuramoyl-L-alanyl-D-glutamate--2,6-diaminopimelate ligase [Oscillospiraceae bacterium]
MKLRDILKDIEIIETNADLDTEITSVEADSRKVTEGALFVAVVGYESDGHRFIPIALSKGAACVLCQNKPEGDVPYVQVANTRKGLAKASANYFGRPSEKMKIVGVTGTNGKTTTTSIIKFLIEKCTGAKVGLIGTNGNMIGSRFIDTERTTPESNELQALFAQMYGEGCQYVVMEVSSHALYLDRVYGVEFDVGCFTNLTEDHLDFHKTMEEYGKAKAILFERCKIGSINIDDAYGALIAENAKCPLVKCSVNKDAEMRAENIALSDIGVEFDLCNGGKAYPTVLNIPGMFSVYNAMTALSAVSALGIDIGEAVKYIAGFGGVMGRAEVVPTGRDFTVIIDYAHTPDALENIIKTVRGFAKGRVVTLFGCGGDRDALKRPIMGKIAAELSDFVIVTSDNPRTEVPMDIINDILVGLEGTKTPYTVIENRREAIGWAVHNAQSRDIIILAGKGHETYQIIGKEKSHFDEREIVAGFLK